jgi:tetratricopeptide (TPR) repeat protein
MLPRANTRFTGRSDQLGMLDDILDEAEDTAGLAVVTGMGGVGKTALAVTWAHRVAHRFPDGRLYFNLRGFDPLASGTDPAAVLGEALVSLGIETRQLPNGLDERIGLYRTVLDKRRILVVLDNARDAEQVRPLLPVAPGSFTLVTSRNRLSGLDMDEGAEPVPLGPLADADAWALLVRRIGMDRALANERAVQRIVAVCGRLPLALTLIGAWAARHPQFSLASLADRLESTTNVIRVLNTFDPAADPRSVFACSYQALPSRAARAFRMFGLHPGPDLTVAAMASLMAVPAVEAEEALAELAGVHLVDQHREGRFAMHDLLRSYAAERVADEVDEHDRAAATRRMIEHYLFTARAAERFASARSDLLDLGDAAPGVHLEEVRDAASAAAWLDAEEPVLRGLIDLELEHRDIYARIWQLRWFFVESIVDQYRGRDRDTVRRDPRVATDRAGTTLGQLVSGGLSGPLILISTEAALHEELARVVAAAAEDRDPGAKAIVSYTLTAGSGAEDSDAEALGYARQGHAYFMAQGNAYWANRMRYGIGWHSARLGDYDEAQESFAQVILDAPPERVPLAKANSGVGFGYVAYAQKRFDDAVRHYSASIAWFEANHLGASAAYAREHLGDTRRAMGDHPAAQREWTVAASAYEELGLIAEAARVRAKIADSFA